MIHLILKGKPISTNLAYRFTCRGRFASMYMEGKAKALKEDYAYQAKQQHKKPPLEEDLSIGLKIYHKDKRKHDIDNYCKLVFDALNGILWKDDNQIIELIIQKYIDKEKPRLEIIVN